MKLHRVSRTCTTQTFSRAFAAAAADSPDSPDSPDSQSSEGIAKAVVYLSATSASAADELRAAMIALGHTGAAEVVAVEPLDQAEEILLVLWRTDQATELSSPAPDVTVARTDGYDVAWFGNVGWSADYEAVFAGTQEKLHAAGMNVADLWKTWSYLPVDASSGRVDEAFVEFNQQRASWFKGVDFHIEAAAPEVPFAFPANTGVGDFAGYFSLSGIAGRVRDGVTRVVEIDNPHQQAPRQYGTGQSGRRTPAHFSRAVGVLGPQDRWILVAGTASVVGSDTANIDVVSAQTAQTLANLATLAAEAARKPGPGGQPVPVPVSSHEAYENLVVYVTYPEHLEVIRRTVQTAAPGIAVTYLRSPLTRVDLLVEMEGELSS